LVYGSHRQHSCRVSLCLRNLRIRLFVRHRSTDVLITSTTTYLCNWLGNTISLQEDFYIDEIKYKLFFSAPFKRLGNLISATWTDALGIKEWNLDFYSRIFYNWPKKETQLYASHCNKNEILCTDRYLIYIIHYLQKILCLSIKEDFKFAITKIQTF
jgi:hypothetical protein